MNAMDKDGNTPLDYADGEIAALLRKHGGKMGEELENAEPVAEAAKVEPPTAKRQSSQFTMLPWRVI